MPKTSRRTAVFTESVIREMSRVASRHGAINLAQGFPDFDPPRELLEAAKAEMDAGHLSPLMVEQKQKEKKEF